MRAIIANLFMFAGLIYYFSQIPPSPLMTLNWFKKIKWCKQIKAEVEIEP